MIHKFSRVNVRTGGSTASPHADRDITIPQFRACLSLWEAKELSADLAKAIEFAETLCWHDSEHGPWDTKEEADNFGDAEVGAAWRTERQADGWHVLILGEP